MPWHKVQNSSQCPADQPWAVVLDSDGSLAGCHANEASADSQLAALYANEGATMTATQTLQDAIAAFQQGNADALIEWYNDGADGQIDWGSPGDFDDCVEIASEHGLDSPEGFCQDRHEDAVGGPAGSEDQSTTGKAFGAIQSHSTATDDEGSWDASAALQKMNTTESNLRAMHAYQDPDGDPETQAAYSYPHHNVNADGSVGAANTTACSSGIAALNGGRGGHSMSTDDKVGVHNHLARHIEDAGGEAPDLKGAGASEQRGGPSTTTNKRITWSGHTADGEPIHVVEDVDDNRNFEMPVMAIEGVWTGDWRWIAPGSLTWRDLPLPAMVLTKTTMDHNDAELCGKIDSIGRDSFGTEQFDVRTGQPYAEGTTFLRGLGMFDTDQYATEIARKVKDGFLRGVSIDVGDAISEFMWVYENGDEVPDDDFDIWDMLFGWSMRADAAPETEDEPDPHEGMQQFLAEKILSGRVMGATICPFPAFEGAFVRIQDTSMAASAATGDERMPSVNMIRTQALRRAGLTAAAAPLKPPRPWFKDPQFDGPTAITITKEGQLSGHLAIWGQEHIAFSGQRILPPHSRTDYAWFHTKSCELADGEIIPTGLITMNTGHAELWCDMDQAKAHYDNTGFATADVRAGEDQWGIWLAGALRPDVDELNVRRLRGAALSGDWRLSGNALELVAALAVNVPGYPVQRPKARVASGAQISLVAAGRITPFDAQRIRERMAKLAAIPEGVLMEAKPDPVLAAATTILDRQARRALREEVHRSSR